MPTKKQPLGRRLVKEFGELRDKINDASFIDEVISNLRTRLERHPVNRDWKKERAAHLRKVSRLVKIIRDGKTFGPLNKVGQAIDRLAALARE